MEKTMARAIYKNMVIGKWYTSYELFQLIEDDFYKYIPVEMQGKDVRRICGAEMWKVVQSGYAETRMQSEKYHMVRGLKYGVDRDWSKVPSKEYSVRYWRRKK